MARPDKVAVVDELAERLQQANAAVLTEYRGLSVDDLAQLRAKLRDADAEYRVVKNTLTRRAAAGAGLDVPDDMLTGPTALTFCAGDPVAATKVLKRFSDDHPALVLKGGVVDGQLLDAEQTRKLADLESREELLSRMAGLMDAVVAQPARLAQAGLSKMARLMAAYVSQREEAGETATSPESAADEQAPPEAASSEGGADTRAEGDGGPATDTEPASDAADGGDPEAAVAESGSEDQA